MDWQLVASYFTVKSTDIFYSVEISLVLLLNKMIDSLFMHLSAARDYSFLRDRICIFTKNGIWCCKFFFFFFRDCHIIVVRVLEFVSKCVKYISFSL